MARAARSRHRQPDCRDRRAGIPQAAGRPRTIDVQGKTIMPGLVDAHSHMWPPRGLHQTEIWQYLSNLAYGVTDHTRSADVNA
jgi:imidazolonepropionase-like amidohydrolase